MLCAGSPYVFSNTESLILFVLATDKHLFRASNVASAVDLIKYASVNRQNSKSRCYGGRTVIDRVGIYPQGATTAIGGLH